MSHWQLASFCILACESHRANILIGATIPQTLLPVEIVTWTLTLKKIPRRTVRRRVRGSQMGVRSVRCCMMLDDRQLPQRVSAQRQQVLDRVYRALEQFITEVPRTNETPASDPQIRAAAIVKAAAARAAVVSGGLALPPGPLGLLTIIPDLVAIWRVQAQMVADVAGVYGKTAELTREQMLYCLFKHAAAQLVRDLAVRVGERVIVRKLTSEAMKDLLQKIGVRITERLIGKSVSRWLPVIGAVGAGAYAYFDTNQVGKTALGLFEKSPGE
jgi:hypothetical protein